MIDMLPREYLLQIYREIRTILPALLDEEQLQQQQIQCQAEQRLEKLKKRYERAIKRGKGGNKPSSVVSEKRREQNRLAQRKHLEKKRQLQSKPI